MFRTFNMGVGLVMMINESESYKVRDQLSVFPEFEVHQIGRVVAAPQKTVRII